MWKNTWLVVSSQRRSRGSILRRRAQDLRRMALQTYLSFVRFSHSVFALPFALTGALLALQVTPLPGREIAWRVAWIVVAMVAARTAAMGFNRLADARWDAKNPRTAMREIPRGAMSRREAMAIVAVASIVFIAAAYQLGPVCFMLSPVA